MPPTILKLADATALQAVTGSPAPPSMAASTTAPVLAVPDLPAAPPPSAGLWVAAALLAGLAVAAFATARRRTRRTRMVEVVESTSIGPRRSLVVARLGDELLLLGSSEAGIALLNTAPAPSRPAKPAAPPARERSSLLGRLRLASQPSPVPTFDALLSESLEDAELRRKLAAGQAGSVR